ncbi:hypothetical protein ACJZ2D_015509 [Fusarium nematophilum]
MAMRRSISQKPHSDKSPANQQNPPFRSVVVCLEAENFSPNANVERRVFVEDSSWIQDADKLDQGKHHDLLLPIRVYVRFPNTPTSSPIPALLPPLSAYMSYSEIFTPYSTLSHAWRHRLDGDKVQASYDEHSEGLI